MNHLQGLLAFRWILVLAMVVLSAPVYAQLLPGSAQGVLDNWPNDIKTWRWSRTYGVAFPTPAMAANPVPPLIPETGALVPKDEHINRIYVGTGAGLDLLAYDYAPIVNGVWGKATTSSLVWHDGRGVRGGPVEKHLLGQGPPAIPLTIHTPIELEPTERLVQIIVYSGNQPGPTPLDGLVCVIADIDTGAVRIERRFGTGATVFASFSRLGRFDSEIRQIKLYHGDAIDVIGVRYEQSKELASIAAHVGPALAERNDKVNIDGDAIDDRDEQALLDMFSPGFRIDGHHFDLPAPNMPPDAGYPIDAGKLVNLAQADRFIVNPKDWPADGSNIGLYGRVWAPALEDSTPGSIVSVQYYLFLTYNARRANNHFQKAGQDIDIEPLTGTHDGDIVCIDLGVDISDRSQPRIVHAILHNHGRQIFLLPNALEMVPIKGGWHPVVYLEAGSNEPWPNASHGNEGWPPPLGFACTKRFVKHQAGLKIMDENEVCGPHFGEWKTYYPCLSDGHVRNLGEVDKPNPAVEDSKLIATHNGTWGTYFKLGAYRVNGSPWIAIGKDDFETSPPNGPPFQPKMWSRNYEANIWKPGTSITDPDLSALFTTCVAGGAIFDPVCFPAKQSDRLQPPP